MRLDNETPLAAIAFRQFRPDGGLDCVVSAKGVFEHRHGHALVWSTEQAPLAFEDVYEGDPHNSALLVQSDITPFKPGTDVTFLGASHAPGGRPSRRWNAQISVGDRLRKDLQITGPRFWEAQTSQTWAGFRAREPRKIVTGWTLSEPQEALSVMLGWDKAFGGPLLTSDGDAKPELHPDNPLGPGRPTLTQDASDVPIRAHQIDAADAPEMDWRDNETPPHGLGPIPPWWRPRQRFAGTYDDAWQATRHPLLPEDFDPRFWQCAHPDLIALPHLAGDELFELVNLDPAVERSVGCLPGIALAVSCNGAGSSSDGLHRLRLDGVHFDFRSGKHRVIMTWRAKLPLDMPERAVLTLHLAAEQAAEVSVA